MEYLIPVTFVYAFLWGAIWGSFLNVVVWRLPRNMSLTRPPSHCPKCSTPIRWYDNVPVFGWLWLRGKCRACKAPISARYPLVEATMGLLSLAIWTHVAHGRIMTEPMQVLAIPFLLHFFFVFALLAIALIDFDLTIIPHELTLPTAAIGLIGALLLPKTGVWVAYHPSVDIVDALVGMVVGAGGVWLVFKGYTLATGRHGMGFGDVTMMGMIGATLGWMSIAPVLMFASLQGLAAALVLFAVEKARPGKGGSLFIRGAWREEFWADEAPLEPDAPERGVAPAEGEEGDGFLKLAVPFGPFLALAAVEYLFFGHHFVGWISGGTL
jgi:leader peptidase (prepilin peptidase)/N-methyltransferase